MSCIMNSERTTLINALIRHKSDVESAMINSSRILKCAEASVKARKNGNRLYVLKTHDSQIHQKILNYYSESIALALNNSEELAFAYGNKSAFLLHLGLYKDCLVDIDKAYRITNNNTLKVKLLCRKVECSKKLGVAECQNTLDAAQNILNKINDSDKDKIRLTALIKRVRELSSCSKSDSKEEHYNRNKFVNSLSKRDEILSSIRIECNKKFGRHLVTVKDYNVGDIIFTEKLYATALDASKRYTNCHHCLKYCWSCVPCAHCSLVIFCSENCQRRAWESYHNVECSLISCLGRSEFSNDFHICIRMLVMGLIEAGSISQLKNDLLCVDTCTDTSLKGFFNDGTFMSNSIQSIYSLTLSNDISDCALDMIAKNVIFILIFLVKYSVLIANCELKEIEDILKNEDLIFLGSLLIKLCKIKVNNACDISNSIQACELSSSSDECALSGYCHRGTCIAPLTSLMNHSCYPNADRCLTDDQKVIVYAIQPIKKKSQIFISYSPLFYQTSLENRQNFMKKHEFVCDCQPCTELWPTFLDNTMKNSQDEFTISNFQNDFEMKLYKDCEYIFEAVKSGQTCFDKNTIKILSKAYVKAWKNLQQPSLLICYLTEALRGVFSVMYGFKMQLPVHCEDE